MVFFKHVVILFLSLSLVSCGSSDEKSDSSSKEKAFVAGFPNLQYLAKFSCKKRIDSEDESDLYNSLGLSGVIDLSYEALTGLNNVRTVGARIENASFLKTASDYFQDTTATAQVTLIADISGSSNGGFWTFGVSNGVAQFIYSDASDLGSTVSGSFSETECLGTVQ